VSAFRKYKKLFQNQILETSTAIGKAKNIMRNETLKNDLISITVNRSLLAHTITTLDTKNVSINDSMQIVESAIEKLKLVSGQIRGGVVKTKIHAVTENNPGFIDFKIINDIKIGRHPFLKLWNYRFQI